MICSWGFGIVRKYWKWFAHNEHRLSHTCKRFPTPLKTPWTHCKHIQKSCRVISNCFHMFASGSWCFGKCSEMNENAWHTMHRNSLKHANVSQPISNSHEHSKQFQKSCSLFANFFHVFMSGSWDLEGVPKCSKMLTHASISQPFQNNMNASQTRSKVCRVCENYFQLIAMCSWCFGSFRICSKILGTRCTYTNSHMRTDPNPFRNPTNTSQTHEKPMSCLRKLFPDYVMCLWCIARLRNVEMIDTRCTYTHSHMQMFPTSFQNSMNP